MSKPALAAHIDWMQQGAFFPERYQGEERKEYQSEAARIEQQWDQQPEQYHVQESRTQAGQATAGTCRP